MRITTTASVALLLIVSCATAKPPTELVNARIAYARVSGGPAARTVPDEVHKAKVALDTAERSFDKQPESRDTRDLAYIAERRSQLAEAKGQIAASGEVQAEADQQFKQTLSDQKDRATQDAARSRQQAEMSEDQRQAEAGQHATDLADANAKTAAAEANNKVLMADLALLGKLSEEARGTVITLAGDVIFATGQATVLPSAQARLDKVADALKAGNYPMVIEGHTDSRGSDGSNQELSTRRATAVRDYLVARGVSADHVQVNGFGEGRPIADNTSAEGRAMNRRVEIVVAGMRSALK